jgi:hypothetical protein
VAGASAIFVGEASSVVRCIDYTPASPAITNHKSYSRIWLQSDGTVSSSFNVSGNITEGTFESVGPTNSGATNIYSAMDNIPLGASFVVFWAHLLAVSSGSTLAALQLYGRPTGSSIAAGDGSRIAHYFWDPDAAETGGLGKLVYVPLDSSRRCDITWNFSNSDTETLNLYYRGFCI